MCYVVAVYSCMQGTLNTASPPVVQTHSTIIQAWPYLGRAQCYVNTLTAEGRAHSRTHVHVHQQCLQKALLKKGNEDSRAVK